MNNSNQLTVWYPGGISIIDSSSMVPTPTVLVAFQS